MWKSPFRGKRKGLVAGEGAGTIPRAEPYIPEFDYEHWFWANATGKDCRRVLEVGTAQALPGRSTISFGRFPFLRREDYVCLDIAPGPDVDVVGDAHALPDEWSDHFDAYLALAVWEHLERPWVAAREVARILGRNGKFLIVTHQTFPLHGYPNDYFRFSREALRLIFEDAGLTVAGADYRYRCIIAPMPPILSEDQIADWNKTFPSFIHVGVAGWKAP